MFLSSATFFILLYPTYFSLFFNVCKPRYAIVNMLCPSSFFKLLRTVHFKQWDEFFLLCIWEQNIHNDLKEIISCVNLCHPSSTGSIDGPQSTATQTPITP